MYIDIDNINVHYKASGEGKDVILLHGWGTNLDTFSTVHNLLEKDFKVYSLDFPGFGNSEEPPEAWGVGEYTQFLASFIEKMGIEKPILIGHSFGCRVITKYAHNHDVHKIIFTGGAGIKPKRKLNYYVKVYTYKSVKKLLDLPILNRYKEDILTKWKGKVGSADYKQASPVMQQSLSKVVNEDLREYMPKIHVPTLLVWGENDTATPLEDGKQMEQLFPDAGLVVLENSGHYAFLEQNKRFLLIVENFLEKDKGE